MITTTTFGQVRIADDVANTVALGSSAFIDASSNTVFNSSTNKGKGLLFPTVDLTTFTSFGGTPIGIPTSYPNFYDGFIVYNTATAGVAGVGSTQGTLSPGFWYYENKTRTITGGIWRPEGGLQVSDTLSIKNPNKGIVVYDTITNSVNYYNGTKWINNASGGTIIPFASGKVVEMQINYSKSLSSNPVLIGFGNSSAYTSAYATSLNLTGTTCDGMNFAFDAPRNGTITSVSATFSLIALSNCSTSGNCTVYAQLFEAKVASNTFTAIANTKVTVGSFTPKQTTYIANKVLSGLNVPVTLGNRYLMVFYTSTSSKDNVLVDGYASAGITIQ